MTFLQGIILKSDFNISEELRGFVSNLDDPASKSHDSPFALITLPGLVELENHQQKVENKSVLFLSMASMPIPPFPMINSETAWPMSPCLSALMKSWLGL